MSGSFFPTLTIKKAPPFGDDNFIVIVHVHEFSDVGKEVGAADERTDLSFKQPLFPGGKVVIPIPIIVFKLPFQDCLLFGGRDCIKKKCTINASILRILGVHLQCSVKHEHPGA